jgi:hypothetical protein
MAFSRLFQVAGGLQLIAGAGKRLKVTFETIISRKKSKLKVVCILGVYVLS